jgi:hypothetical protein
MSPKTIKRADKGKSRAIASPDSPLAPSYASMTAAPAGASLPPLPAFLFSDHPPYPTRSGQLVINSTSHPNAVASSSRIPGAGGASSPFQPYSVPSVHAPPGDLKKTKFSTIDLSRVDSSAGPRGSSPAQLVSPLSPSFYPTKLRWRLALLALTPSPSGTTYRSNGVALPLTPPPRQNTQSGHFKYLHSAPMLVEPLDLTPSPGGTVVRAKGLSLPLTPSPHHHARRCTLRSRAVRCAQTQPGSAALDLLSPDGRTAGEPFSFHMLMQFNCHYRRPP